MKKYIIIISLCVILLTVYGCAERDKRHNYDKYAGVESVLDILYSCHDLKSLRVEKYDKENKQVEIHVTTIKDRLGDPEQYYYDKILEINQYLADNPNDEIVTEHYVIYIGFSEEYLRGCGMPSTGLEFSNIDYESDEVMEGLYTLAWHGGDMSYLKNFSDIRNMVVYSAGSADNCKHLTECTELENVYFFEDITKLWVSGSTCLLDYLVGEMPDVNICVGMVN